MDLGIDIGGTKIQGAYLRGDDVILTAKRPTSKRYDLLLAALMELAREATDACGEPVTRVGIGVPGTATDRRVTWTPNLPFLDGKDLADDLGGKLSAEVMVGNDGQFALLGEVWRGAARDRRNVILVSVGTGVGGAIYMNGRLLRGSHGSAGAFGWLNLDWREPPNPNHGYLELYGSGTALDAMGRSLDPPLTAYELVARARAGDRDCAGLVERFAAILGAAFASLASILDPEVIIVSGGLAEAFDMLAPTIPASLREHGSPSVRETPVVVGQLGSSAAAYGALRAAMLQRAVWE